MCFVCDSTLETATLCLQGKAAVKVFAMKKTATIWVLNLFWNYCFAWVQFSALFEFWFIVLCTFSNSKKKLPLPLVLVFVLSYSFTKICSFFLFSQLSHYCFFNFFFLSITLQSSIMRFHQSFCSPLIQSKIKHWLVCHSGGGCQVKDVFLPKVISKMVFPWLWVQCHFFGLLP